MNRHFARQCGISLIESLVALVVISVGALSVSSLHSNLVASSGLSKARSEAVQLAQGNNEELRNMVQPGHYNVDIVSGSSPPIDGINATFNLAWTVTDQTASSTTSGKTTDYGYKRIATTVTWNDPKEGPQTVTQATQVAWNDPVDSVAAAYGDSGVTSYASPQGKAVRAGPNVLMIDRTKDGVQTIDEGGGYKVLIEGYEVQLVSDVTNKVILTMRSSTAGQGFSTISGKVYIDKDHTLGTGNNQVDQSRVTMRSSTEGECIRSFDEANPDVQFSLFEEGPYYYYTYKCYVGEGWYGNIGIVRLDSSANRDRVCVGDPTVSPTTVWDSRHPAMDTVRRYRGYVETSPGVFKAYGIGLDPAAPGYTETHYENHHFLLTPISGSPNDASCKSPMEKGSNNTLLVGNPGKNYCMTTHCYEEMIPEDPVVLIQGRISRLVDNGQLPVLSAIQISSGNCTIIATTSEYYDYKCETLRVGWTGETWSDEMILVLATGNTLKGTKSGNGAEFAVIDVDNASVLLRQVPVKLFDPADPETVLDLVLNLEISTAPVVSPVTTTITGTITRVR
jgi:type II secretory pathway pseudopilin PulG